MVAWIRSPYIRNSGARSIFTKSATIGSIYIRSTYIKKTCISNIYVRKSLFARDACVKDANIEGAATLSIFAKSAWVRNTSAGTNNTYTKVICAENTSYVKDTKIGDIFTIDVFFKITCIKLTSIGDSCVGDGCAVNYLRIYLQLSEILKLKRYSPVLEIWVGVD